MGYGLFCCPMDAVVTSGRRLLVSPVGTPPLGESTVLILGFIPWRVLQENLSLRTYHLWLMNGHPYCYGWHFPCTKELSSNKIVVHHSFPMVPLCKSQTMIEWSMGSCSEWINKSWDCWHFFSKNGGLEWFFYLGPWSIPFDWWLVWPGGQVFKDPGWLAVDLWKKKCTKHHGGSEGTSMKPNISGYYVCMYIYIYTLWLFNIANWKMVHLWMDLPLFSYFQNGGFPVRFV